MSISRKDIEAIVEPMKAIFSDEEVDKMADDIMEGIS